MAPKIDDAYSDLLDMCYQSWEPQIVAPKIDDTDSDLNYMYYQSWEPQFVAPKINNTYQSSNIWLPITQSIFGSPNNSLINVATKRNNATLVPKTIISNCKSLMKEGDQSIHLT